MKGMNMRKVAALAGAVLLGASAFAMAEVTYGSAHLVDQNGQPLVKIYIGSKAMASDGVAAANIAAAIANEAYKISMSDSSKAGTGSCAAGPGATGPGICQIDPNSKRVTLRVEFPGEAAETHTFQTLITDTIDRTLGNRNITRAEDSYAATMTALDTFGSTTSAIRAVETDTEKGKLL